MPEPVPRGTYSANPLPPHPHRRPLFVRLLIPMLFLGAAAAVVIGLQRFLQQDRNLANTKPGGATAGGSSVNVILPEDQTPPKSVKPVDDTPSAPTPTPDLSPIINPNIEPAEGIAPVSPGVLGLAVLEKFLSAKTLQERLPMLETKESPETLASSSLAKPFPPRLNIETDVHVPNTIENYIDIFYNVEFEGQNGKPVPQTILVRMRGSQEPKIVADPFLDLYDGRLAAYAANPTDKSGTFQAIVSADAFCWDENIPNKDTKLTLKLLSRENTREITRAYFSKHSKIAELLDSQRQSEWTYGQAKAATVLLQWNTEEDPEKPFLEALDIKALRWNP